MSGNYTFYTRELFLELRRRAARARATRIANGNTEVDCAYEGALINVMRLMQDMAIGVIEPEEVGMAGFDPLVDELDPEKP